MELSCSNASGMATRKTSVFLVAAREPNGEETRDYLDWLLKACTTEGADIDALVEPAVAGLTSRESAVPRASPISFARYSAGAPLRPMDWMRRDGQHAEQVCRARPWRWQPYRRCYERKPIADFAGIGFRESTQ